MKIPWDTLSGYSEVRARIIKEIAQSSDITWSIIYKINGIILPTPVME